MSGRGGPGNGASFDFATYCNNPCIMGLNGEFWAPNDLNFTRYWFRPYCDSAGIYYTLLNNNNPALELSMSPEIPIIITLHIAI
jgi:hypothetical protein